MSFSRKSSFAVSGKTTVINRLKSNPNILIVSGDDGVFVYDTSVSSTTLPLRVLTKEAAVLATFSPSEDTLFIATWDNNLIRFDFKSGAQQKSKWMSRDVCSLAIHPNPSPHLLVVCGIGYGASLLDPTTLEQTVFACSPDGSSYDMLVFSATFLLGATGGGVVTVMDLELNLLRVFSSESLNPSCAISPDERLLAIGLSGSGVVSVYELDNIRDVAAASPDPVATLPLVTHAKEHEAASLDFVSSQHIVTAVGSIISVHCVGIQKALASIDLKGHAHFAAVSVLYDEPQNGVGIVAWTQPWRSDGEAHLWQLDCDFVG